MSFPRRKVDKVSSQIHAENLVPRAGRKRQASRKLCRSPNTVASFLHRTQFSLSRHNCAWTERELPLIFQHGKHVQIYAIMQWQDTEACLNARWRKGYDLCIAGQDVAARSKLLQQYPNLRLRQTMKQEEKCMHSLGWARCSVTMSIHCRSHLRQWTVPAFGGSEPICAMHPMVINLHRSRICQGCHRTN